MLCKCDVRNQSLFMPIRRKDEQGLGALVIPAYIWSSDKHTVLDCSGGKAMMIVWQQ